MNTTDPIFIRAKPHEDVDRQRTVDYVWDSLQALRRDQWLPPAEIERRQLDGLRSLVAHCIQHVPYYREKFSVAGAIPHDIGLCEALSRLPILSRPVFQSRAHFFRAQALPDGMIATGVASTSGSTGIPVRVQQTNLVNAAWCAFALRDLEWCGIDPRGSLAAIRNTSLRGNDRNIALQGVSSESWGRPLSGIVETGPSHLLSIEADFQRQRKWLEALNPNYLLSTATNLDALTAMFAEPQIPALRTIQSIAEAMTEEMRERVETRFGAPVRDMYTCQETGYLASQCPTHAVFHVHAENVILEVLDKENRPCPAGQVGRVVLTCLLNYATPLVRYEIGDEAVLGEHCDCGRGLPTLLSVLGKQRPFFRLPVGRLKSTTTLASGISKVAGVHQYQFEQRTPEDIVLRLVPDESWNQDCFAKVSSMVGEFFESPVQLSIELCARIQPGPGGKIRSFIAQP